MLDGWSWESVVSVAAGQSGERKGAYMIAN